MATPAWKRLGLKLKYANEIQENVYANGMTATRPPGARPEESLVPSAEPPLKKRKTERRSKENSSHPSTSSSPPPSVTNHHPGKALKKQVSFSVDTKPALSLTNGNARDDDLTAAVDQTSTTGKKNKKKSGKKPQQPRAQKSNAALDYLNQYHTARSTWKFNKSSQTWILKHALSESDISRGYDLGLAEYIHGLQGTAARERLKTQCVGLLEKEAATQNGSDWPEEDPSLNAQYAQRFMDKLESSSNSEPSDENGDVPEQEYKSWIQKQPRSKLLLWALGLDDKTLVSNGSASKPKALTGHADGVGSTVKAKKRKNRTAVVDYDSSSSSLTSSSSDSESESESEYEEEKILADTTAKEETSSSGSDEETSSDDSGSSTEVE